MLLGNDDGWEWIAKVAKAICLEEDVGDWRYEGAVLVLFCDWALGLDEQKNINVFLVRRTLTISILFTTTMCLRECHFSLS
jgi:hypothetical protein